MRKGLLPEEVPGSRGEAGRPDRRGARRGRSAGGRGVPDADSNQTSDPEARSSVLSESLRGGVRNGSCEIPSKNKGKLYPPKGRFGSHFLSGHLQKFSK